MDFSTAFDRLIGHEGGYANHPSDPGGETMWGVTKRVAQSNGYTGAMRDFPRDSAKAIYRKSYWDAVQADSLPAAMRYAVFDAAVNSGVSQGIKWLQRAVGVVDDGVIGPVTINAANALDARAVAGRMLGERLDFMTSLPTWPAFGKGWARRIASELQNL